MFLKAFLDGKDLIFLYLNVATLSMFPVILYYKIIIIILHYLLSSHSAQTVKVDQVVVTVAGSVIGWWKVLPFNSRCLRG